MLPPEQYSPCNTTRVLALQEEGLGFAVLKAKDFAVATDIKLALDVPINQPLFPLSLSPDVDVNCRCCSLECCTGGGVLKIGKGKHTFPG